VRIEDSCTGSGGVVEEDALPPPLPPVGVDDDTDDLFSGSIEGEVSENVVANTVAADGKFKAEEEEEEEEEEESLRSFEMEFRVGDGRLSRATGI